MERDDEMKKTLSIMALLALLTIGLVSLAGCEAGALARIPKLVRNSANAPGASTVAVLKKAHNEILAAYPVDATRFYRVNHWDLSDLTDDKAPPATVDNLEEIIAIIISTDREHHKIGDYAPLYLIAKDGCEVVIAYNRGDKEIDVFSYSLDNQTNEWEVTRIAKKVE